MYCKYSILISRICTSIKRMHEHTVVYNGTLLTWKQAHVITWTHLSKQYWQSSYIRLYTRITVAHRCLFFLYFALLCLRCCIFISTETLTLRKCIGIIFFNSICSLHALCHTVVILPNILRFFITVFVMVICDQWSLILLLSLMWHFLGTKYFTFWKVYALVFFFRQCLIHYSIMWTSLLHTLGHQLICVTCFIVW